MQTTKIQLMGRFLLGEANIVQTDPTEPLYYDLAIGRRLVIESISAQAFGPKGDSTFLSLVVINPRNGSTEVIYQIPLAFQATYNPVPQSPSEPLRDIWSMHQLVKVYISGGVRLQLDGGRGPSCSGPGEANVVITGTIETASLFGIPQFINWPMQPAP